MYLQSHVTLYSEKYQLMFLSCYVKNSIVNCGNTITYKRIKPATHNQAMTERLKQVYIIENVKANLQMKMNDIFFF